MLCIRKMNIMDLTTQPCFCCVFKHNLNVAFLIINMQNTVIVLCSHLVPHKRLNGWPNNLQILKLNTYSRLLNDSRNLNLLKKTKILSLSKCVDYLPRLKWRIQFCVFTWTWVVVCVFKAAAAVPAVVFSSPEVKIRRVSLVGGGRGDFTGGGLCCGCSV